MTDNDLEPVNEKKEVVVIKEIEDDLKDLYFKRKHLRIEAMKAQLQTKMTGAAEDFQAYRELDHQADITNETFWHAIRKRYNIWIPDRIGIRENFSVVIDKPHDHKKGEKCENCGTDHSDLGEMIKKILGLE